MSYYVARNKYTLRGFVFNTIASWVVLSVAMVILGLVMVATGYREITGDSFQWPLSALLWLCLAYAVIGNLCLWGTMWVYWIVVERSSVLVRIGWFLVLLFGMNMGAVIYAIAVWRKDVKKVDGFRPIRGVPYLDD